MKNQLDRLEMLAEVAPRYSGLLSHSSNISPRGPARVRLETQETLGSEHPCPVGQDIRKG